MYRHPIELVAPFYAWLDTVIRDQGLYIYLVMVWLAPFVIAWVLSGGLRSKQVRHEPILIIYFPPEPIRAAPPPPLPRAKPPPLPDDEGSSFAA